MTERSSEGLDERRRKLLFRAWQRGVREMDLIVGRFADAHIDKFDDVGLDDFERLIEAPNAELYSWVIGAELCRRPTTPPCSPSFALFTAGKLKCAPRGTGDDTGENAGAVAGTAPCPGPAAAPLPIVEGAEGLVVADLARAVAARPKAPAISLAVVCRDGPRMATGAVAGIFRARPR